MSEFEKYGTWQISGDRRDELKKLMSQQGLKKPLWRRRFSDGDVLVTYRTENGTTRVSLRATMSEYALPVYNAISERFGVEADREFPRE